MQIPFINLASQYNENKSSIDQAINKVLTHGQYIMGPEVAELEAELSSYIGVKHTLACSSGTDALVLPLMAQDVNQGDAIFTSPFTFFASAESISLVGATPIFVDIDPDTYNLDVQDLQNKIQQVKKQGNLNAKGIIPVDLFGLAADYNAIQKLADIHGLFILEDAAQSFGAAYKGKKAGGLADVAATSFYPAKPLGCYGDGGAVFTNDDILYEKLVSLRVHGQAKSGDKYDNIHIGLNARMDTIQAAVLLEKLKFYDEELEKRNEVAAQYSRRLSNYCETPSIPDGYGSVWAQYTIQVDDREKLKNDLMEKGIPTAVFYPIPIHLSTAYQHLEHKVGDFPVAELAAKHVISLPMHPYLKTGTIDYICDCVIESVA